MPKKDVQSLKEDLVEIFLTLFGKDTAKLFSDAFDEKDVQNSVAFAENTIAEMVGIDNAKKYLSRVYENYPELLKVRK